MIVGANQQPGLKAGRLGRLDDARAIVERLRVITPVVIPPDASFPRNPEHRELFMSGLRLAAGEVE